MKLVLPYNNMLSLYFLHFQSKEQVLRHKTEKKQIFNLIFTNDLVSIFLYEKINVLYNDVKNVFV